MTDTKCAAGSPAGPQVTAQQAALESARARLLAHGEVEAPALGRSMGPGFTGAEALVIARLAGRPRLGDVVVFERGGRWVAHRLLACWRGRAVTQGDALWMPDWPPCRLADLEGRVVAAVHAGRRVPIGASRARALSGSLRALACLLRRAWRR